MEYRERITANGKDYWLTRASNPVDVEPGEGLAAPEILSVHDPDFLPSNYDKPEGTPLPLLKAEGFRLDLSRRTKQAMGFWHRNVDQDEVIICVEGGSDWETEMGPVHLDPGELFVIPKGIMHRAVPAGDRENFVIELKIKGAVENVAPRMKQL